MHDAMMAQSDITSVHALNGTSSMGRCAGRFSRKSRFRLTAGKLGRAAAKFSPG
jgi:hypothetical protein